MSRVSFASPRSARFQEFSNSVCRVARCLQHREIGLLRRVLQRDDVSLDLASFGGFGGGGDLRVGQARERALSVVTNAASFVAASSLSGECLR